LLVAVKFTFCVFKKLVLPQVAAAALALRDDTVRTNGALAGSPELRQLCAAGLPPHLQQLENTVNALPSPESSSAIVKRISALVTEQLHPIARKPGALSSQDTVKAKAAAETTSTALEELINGLGVLPERLTHFRSHAQANALMDQLLMLAQGEVCFGIFPFLVVVFSLV
jgi:hypothetical protein